MPDPIDSEANDLPSPISISVTLRMVTTNGHRVKFEADAETREKIVDMFDLIELDSFIAKATLVPWKRDGVQLDGEIIASLSQTCVVSLESVPDRIVQNFQLRLVREGSKLARQWESLDEEAPVPVDRFRRDDAFGQLPAFASTNSIHFRLSYCRTVDRSCAWPESPRFLPVTYPTIIRAANL